MKYLFLCVFIVLAACKPIGGSQTTPGGVTSSYGAPVSRAGGPVANHILTFGKLHAWNGGGNVSAAQAAPYLSWAANPNASYFSAIHSAGIKAYDYTDVTIAYSCGGCSEDWNDLQAHIQYVSDDCSGQDIGNGSSGEYIDLTQTGWYPFYQNWIASNESSVSPLHWDAEFADDADSHHWDSKDPCNATESTFTTAIGTMMGGTGTPMIFNGLSVTGVQPDEKTLYNPSNVMGGMEEECYATDNGIETGTAWQTTENDQIYAALSAHKLFICYGNNGAAASSAIAARTYVYASLGLTYDQSTSALFEGFAPNAGDPGLDVYPESGLVPTNPVAVTPSSISGLKAASGIYNRPYNDCYLNGVDKGFCDFAVNSTAVAITVANWNAKVHHQLVLVGGSVLEGGTATVGGSAPPLTVPADSAFIMFQ
jgi:hypothetical protein